MQPLEMFLTRPQHVLKRGRGEVACCLRSGEVVSSPELTPGPDLVQVQPRGARHLEPGGLAVRGRGGGGGEVRGEAEPGVEEELPRHTAQQRLVNLEVDNIYLLYRHVLYNLPSTATAQ